MRKILRILSFCLVLGVVLSTQSFAISYFDSIIETEIITDKMIFAAEMDAVYAKNLAKGNIESKSIEEIELLQYKYILADDEDKEAIKEELAMAGVYIYISENDVEKQEISLLASDSSDVELDKPVVSYLSFEQTWAVSCAGRWKNDNWHETWEGLGTYEIGGREAFGVVFNNIQRQYESYVVRCSGKLWDADMEHYKETTSRSGGDGSLGFGFELQDETHNALIGSYYIGDVWGASCTYDANFGRYAGIATAYYIHTYDDCEIQTVSFGISGTTTTLNIILSNNEKSFPAYSEDTTFGVYN